MSDLLKNIIRFALFIGIQVFILEQDTTTAQVHYTLFVFSFSAMAPV